jgi:esterase/lipase superfamily enzyme
MRTEHHVWYSPRMGHDMGVAVFGHWGTPLLAFPTSHGDEWEMQRGGMIAALAEFVEAGRVKIFCVGSNNHESFLNRSAHPFHRSWRQRMFDEYIRAEVVPLIHASCQSGDLPIATVGASLGAYHAANSLFRYPDVFKACYALSGIFDLRRFMDGLSDDNFYFHNPVDYVANLHDRWVYEQLASCEIRLVTGSGPWEQSHYSYAFSAVLAQQNIRHHLDDWGPRGGHDWPFWRDEMREYLRGWR